MHELDPLLPWLQPPPGGLARLRQRVGASDGRARQYRYARGWAWFAAAAAVPALALILWLPPRLARHRQTQALVSALRVQMTPTMPPAGIRVAHAAAIALPSGQPDVRLYLVQSEAPPPAPKGEAQSR